MKTGFQGNNTEGLGEACRMGRSFECAVDTHDWPGLLLSAFIGVHRRLHLVFALVLFSLVLPAHAQQYPSRPIRLIVPLAAGGGMDTVARGIALKLTDSLGQTMVVD